MGHPPSPRARNADRALADVHVVILVRRPDRCLPRDGGGVAVDGGKDEKMQDLPENARRTRAQQAAESALVAADVAIGIGDGAVGFARSVFRSGRPLLDSVVSPLAAAARTAAARTAAPVSDRTGQEWLRQAAARGRQDREAVTSAVVRLVLARVPGLTNALLDQLDLTALVAERVDINAVAAQLDVNAIAQRVDVIAILKQMDPGELTRYLVEDMDLPAVIQSSTGTIMSDAVNDVRMQSIGADERLNRAVDAILLRNLTRRKAAQGAAGSGPTTGTGDGTMQATT